MPNESWTARFYIYPIEIVQFLEYCKRFQVIENLQVSFTLDKEWVEEDSFIYKDGFVCDVSFHSQMDSLKFTNVFSLFFKVSKYCSMV